ncbi:MAG: DUF3160 domain-containing protein, partial [Anaerolineae bacterium]|nr:DUF3160 domain-containing protein [Anaerolineae bacterium]
MNNHRRPRLVSAFVASAMIFSVLVSGCASPGPGATEPPPSPTVAPLPSPTLAPTEGAEPTVEPTAIPTEGPQVHVGLLASPLPVASEGFASYEPVQVSLPATHAGYSLPVELNSAIVDESFVFSEAQRQLLSANGFVVAPSEYKEFFHLYEEARYAQVPTFITTDSVYHTYHLFFDQVLRTLEDERFYGDLEKLTAGMLWATEGQYETLKGTSLEQAVLRNLAYFALAQQLLNPGSAIPPAVLEQVQSELALIEAHGGFAESPILGYPEDYSQYVARGHYAKNETRQRYFKVMMWYGR